MMKRAIAAVAVFLCTVIVAYGQAAQPVIPLQAGSPVGVGNPLYIQGSLSASLGGFTPSASGARMTPLSVTTSDSSGNLPTGGVVVVSNAGLTNPMYCNVNGVAATTSDQPISANSWFAFTIPSGVTTLHCIATGGSTTANGVGGTGLPTGSGGGGGGGSSANASVSATGSAVPASATYLGIISGGNLVGWTGAVTAASWPLPTGAATSALQSTINTTLGSPFQAGGSIGNTTFASTVANGADVALGSTTDAAAANSSATATLIAVAKGVLGAAQGSIHAGSALIGSVGIDQTTPGTTNKVVASVASGGMASGAIASGAVASGAFASGAVSSGAIASGAIVDLGAQADATCGTATGTCSLIALQKFANTALGSSIPAGPNLIGAVNAFQGGSALGVTNGLYSNLLQGNAVLSATNGIYANLMVGNAAVATGTGAQGATVPRVTVATDTATIAGSAPGTAGTASANVVTVQGVTSMTPLLVTQAANADPCSSGAKTNLPISFQTTSITQLIALSGSTKIYVCSLSLISSAATVFSVTGGTGTNCGTPAALIGTTSATHGLSLAANGGMTLGNGSGTVAVTGAGSELCLVQSGAGDLVGNLTYVQQ